VLEEPIKPRRTESVVAIVAIWAANRQGQIVPCRMISNVSHANVLCLVADSEMCLDTASDNAFENNGCTARSFVARQKIGSVNHLNALFNCVQYDASPKQTNTFV
jgi:hypothetical protein